MAWTGFRMVTLNELVALFPPESVAVQVTLLIPVENVEPLGGEQVIETCPESSLTVSYTVTASDDSGQVSITCSPPSGSTFSTGINSVTCTATDSGGNKAT